MSLIVSESVAAGHPDKLADQISDALLDEYLLQDPDSRVAIEVLVAGTNVVVAGEVSSLGSVDVEAVVRGVIRDIGYREDHYSWSNVRVDVFLRNQSPEIARSVAGESGVLKAGDQGSVFGYATNATLQFIPLTSYYTHKLMKSIASLEGLGPDGKLQLGMRRLGSADQLAVEHLVISVQHQEDHDYAFLLDKIRPILEAEMPHQVGVANLLLNPSGSFIFGGPKSDCGLTGRKLMVDTYGGCCPHGGGAFSGKDCTKIDRSGAYFARYLAKNIVAAGLSEECLVQICYAIGRPEPISMAVDTKGGKVPDAEIVKQIRANLDLSLSGVIDLLQLKAPIYRNTATYGHFGRRAEGGYFPWEKLDLVPLFTSLCR